MSNAIVPAPLSNLTLKRLLGDQKLIMEDPLEYIDAKPDETDALTWHFLLKGPDDSPYKDGWYIGQILFPAAYPLSPPDFKMLTPSGRFTINTKICMTFSGYHADQWSAMWTIQAILVGFLSIMLSDANQDKGISAIVETKAQREAHAKKSIEYNLKHYHKIFTSFNMMVNLDGTVKSKDETKQLVILAIETAKQLKESKKKSKKGKKELEPEPEPKLESELVKKELETELVKKELEPELVKKELETESVKKELEPEMIVIEQKKPRKTKKAIVD